MSEAKRITISEARKLALQIGMLICWRPEPALPEAQQYCLLF